MQIKLSEVKFNMSLETINSINIKLKPITPFYQSLAFLLVIFLLIIFSKYFEGASEIKIIFTISFIIIFTSDLFFRINFFLNTKLNEKSIYLLDSLFKIVAYSLLLILFILEPFGGPINFLIPNLFAIDYYFIISFWLFFNLYHAIVNTMKNFQ